MESMMSSLNSNQEDFTVRMAKQLKSAKILARLPYEIRIL